jgi:hypothetical protein
MFEFIFYLLLIFFIAGILTYQYGTELPARRQARSWTYKLNPKNALWLFYENDDDGVLGPEWYVPPNKLFVFSSFYFLGLRLRYPKFFTIVKNNDVSSKFGYSIDRTFLKEKSQSKRWRKLSWWFRNPAHNLTFYVIGVVDQHRVYRCKYGTNIHKPGGGLLIASTVLVSSKMKLFCLPFASYISPYVKTYIGWRPAGAFGIKLNLSITGKIVVN